MQQVEAINLIKSKYPNNDIGQVTETDEYFIINILPKRNNTDTLGTEYDIIESPMCDDCLKAVNKETKSIFTYNPIKHGEQTT